MEIVYVRGDATHASRVRSVVDDSVLGPIEWSEAGSMLEVIAWARRPDLMVLELGALEDPRHSVRSALTHSQGAPIIVLSGGDAIGETLTLAALEGGAIAAIDLQAPHEVFVSHLAGALRRARALHQGAKLRAQLSRPPEHSPRTGTTARVQAEIQQRTFELDESNARLARSQAMLRMAGRIARFGAWSYDVVEHALSWSDEVYDIHEAARDFVPSVADGLSFYEPASQPAIKDAFEHCILDGTPFDLELLIHTVVGRLIWVRTVGEAVRDTDNRIIRVEGAFQDINDQVLTREAAKRSADDLIATLESISDAFFTLDTQWCFQYINRQAEALLGRPREDLLGRAVWAKYPSAVGGVFEREYTRVVKERVTSTFEAYYAPLSKWLEVRAYPTPEGIAVYFRDATERKRRDDQLRMQAELINRTQDAILVSDLEHRIVLWNDSAERIYGWTRAEAVGRSIPELLHRDLSGFDQAIAKTLTSGLWSGELTQVTRDGRTLVIESRSTLLRSTEGAAETILVINSDVTERKKLEQQYLRAQRMESIGTLAGGIAHDLNNVLAPIMMSIDLLRLTIDKPEAQETLELIGNSAKRGAEMVGQVLSFARGVDGARVEVQPRHLLHDVRKLIVDTFPKAIRVETEVDPELATILGDATQLHQVLLNLCVNARDAMPMGGTLKLSAANLKFDAHYAAMNIEALEGPYIRIDVEDNGTGIPRQILDKIFDPFFTTKEMGKGTGLGLATSLAIIKSHGGFIRAYSDPGSGTRMRVYLPAHTSGALQAPIDTQASLPRGHGELVMVVDDEASIRQITRQTLEAFGYRVLLAADGSEAVSLYAQRGHEIDVVLTDMMMPVMDGVATIQVLRRLNPNVRIVAASGITANGRVARAADAGVHHFVPKPYTAETLLKILRQVLSDV
jgi:PAS domain S-box-containing protein